jgi:hypothetical protein
VTSSFDPIQQIVSAIQEGERRPAAQRPRRARGAARGDRGRVQAPALAAARAGRGRSAARPRRRSAPGSRSRCRCSRPLTSRRSSPPTATGARACCPTSPAWSRPPTSRAWALVALDCALEPTPTEEAIANLLASLAPFERQLISQRTQGGARGHARARRPARTPPDHLPLRDRPNQTRANSGHQPGRDRERTQRRPHPPPPKAAAAATPQPSAPHSTEQPNLPPRRRMREVRRSGGGLPRFYEK